MYCPRVNPLRGAVSSIEVLFFRSVRNLHSPDRANISNMPFFNSAFSIFTVIDVFAGMGKMVSVFAGNEFVLVLSRITVISWLDSPEIFRYATVIETNDAYGIWCGYYSNTCYINLNGTDEI